METATAEREYKQASRTKPCPICKSTHWCRIASDGTVFCRHSESGVALTDKLGQPFWAHFAEGSGNGAGTDATGLPVLADSEDLDAVYGAILSRLALRGKHRAELAARGVCDARFFELGYRTLIQGYREGLVKEPLRTYGEALLRTVPGYCRNRGRPWLHGAVGLVFPVRNLAGRIVALSVRGSGDRKYSWVSSTAYGGPGPGSPVHVPLWGGDRRVVRVTEGALKSDVSTFLTGIWTLGLPGLGGLESLCEILRAVGPDEIRLAYNRDASENESVGRAQARAWERLKREGYPVRLEVWNGREGD